MSNAHWTAHMPLATAPGLTGGSGGQTVDPSGNPAGPQGGAQGAPPSLFGGPFMMILLGMIVFMIVTSMMSGRKEKKRRQEMLDSLRKYDRVQTAGGMLGTIVEVKSDEVVIKVDESTNTRIHFARSAVQNVVKQSGAAASTSDSEETADTGLEPAEKIA